ncbi:hypothetical protein [Actinoplanes sp. NPDC048796]|uniref:hypothetical protein n=1 Tax=Actinoplanes sp. NPDC048796 TaxID=3155640 RepID=UPI0033F73715
MPGFTRWPSFPFEGDMRVKPLAAPVEVEPPRAGEDAADCVACNTPDEAYIWVSERWRVRAMDRPTGLPVVVILECRSHLDLGDLPNLLSAELGVMTVRLERAIRSLDGVARVHVNRWGDGSAHLHMWFLARPYGRLQLRGTFLSLWDDILPVIPEHEWHENLALVAAWLAEFGGKAIAEPAHIKWESPSTINLSPDGGGPDGGGPDGGGPDGGGPDGGGPDGGGPDGGGVDGGGLVGGGPGAAGPVSGRSDGGPHGGGGSEGGGSVGRGAGGGRSGGGGSLGGGTEGGGSDAGELNDGASGDRDTADLRTAERDTADLYGGASYGEGPTGGRPATLGDVEFESGEEPPMIPTQNPQAQTPSAS